MAMKVKAVERLVKFNKNDAGTYRYVLAPELYSSLSQIWWSLLVLLHILLPSKKRHPPMVNILKTAG